MIFAVCEEIFVTGERLRGAGVCNIRVKGSFVAGDCRCCWPTRMGALNDVKKIKHLLYYIILQLFFYSSFIKNLKLTDNIDNI